MTILLKDDPEIAKAYEAYSYFNQDRELRQAYEDRQKFLRDQHSLMVAGWMDPMRVS